MNTTEEHFAIILSEDEEKITINLEGYDDPNLNVVKISLSPQMFMSDEDFVPYRKVVLTYQDLTIKELFLNMEEQQDLLLDGPRNTIYNLMKNVSGLKLLKHK